MKYRGQILKVAYVIIDNNTCQPCNPTETERLIDAIYGEKFTPVYLYSKAGEVTAKTQRELSDKIWQFVEQNKIGYDFEVFTTKI